MPDPVEVAAALLQGASRVLVFTGAGISTESGIPDFRGPDGLWTRVDPEDFSISRYLTSSAARRRSWIRWSTSPIRGARPNDAHLAIVDLARMGRLEGCVTQNIDGLHQAAGLPDHLTVELHGNVWSVRCLACAAGWPTTEVFERVESGDEDPHCPDCGGIIKLTVISFGQAMPAWEMDRAYAMAGEADAVLAVGSTLSVWPAADIPLAAARRGVPFVILNMGPTDFDQAADHKIEQPAGEALTRLVALLGEHRDRLPSSRTGSIRNGSDLT